MQGPLEVIQLRKQQPLRRCRVPLERGVEILAEGCCSRQRKVGGCKERRAPRNRARGSVVLEPDRERVPFDGSTGEVRRHAGDVRGECGDRELVHVVGVDRRRGAGCDRARALCDALVRERVRAADRRDDDAFHRKDSGCRARERSVGGMTEFDAGELKRTCEAASSACAYAD